MATTKTPVSSPGGGAQPAYGAKDASHAAFYAGFFKGIFSAFDGILLFSSRKPLRAVFWDVLKPLRNAQVAYAAIGVLLFLFLRDPADDLTELFWTISRWGRVVTVVTTFLLDKRLNANSVMFFAALKQLDPSFGAALEAKEKGKVSMRDRWHRFKRVAKLTLFKMAGALINLIFPGGRRLAIPAVKFVSMRPTLGTPVAAALSVIYALPIEFLESSHVDDMLISFGEAILDADGLGTDLTKAYSSRLNSEDSRNYFADRYRGYITGCGFVYSLLSAVPFLGVPMTMVAECGAACVVVDIVKRNLDKTNRHPLACEDALQKTQ